MLDYHQRVTVSYGPKDEVILMCKQIKDKFITEIIYLVLFYLAKVVHLGLLFRAYRQAKHKFEDDERKKRRKDRYNEMVRKKYIFDEKRKV